MKGHVLNRSISIIIITAVHILTKNSLLKIFTMMTVEAVMLMIVMTIVVMTTDALTRLQAIPTLSVAPKANEKFRI